MNNSECSSRARDRDKALLIGITYRYPEVDGVDPLSRPHKDVADFRNHLIRKWRYPEQNITVMLDKRVDHSMQPTRKNIIRELRELAKDAQPGDRRVFYFAGHCYQIVNRSEEDELDEALLTHGHNGEPFDAQGRPLDPDNMPPDDPDRKKLEGLIVDNELRNILVDHLPPGVTLVAVFDTCHSGTLLDLKHYWSNKITRALSLPLTKKCPAVGAELEMIPKVLRSRAKVYSPQQSRTNTTQSGTLETAVHDGPPVLPLLLIRTESFDVPFCKSPSSETSVDMEFSFSHMDEPSSRTSKAPTRHATLTEVGLSLPSGRCDSLRALTPCASNCSNTSSGRSSPRVISLSASADHQIVMEGRGVTMTSAFIEVFESSEEGGEADPITYTRLMDRLRFRMFTNFTRWLWDTHKEKKWSLGGRFQRNRRRLLERVPSPQLGGEEHLDLNETFAL